MPAAAANRAHLLGVRSRARALSGAGRPRARRQRRSVPHQLQSGMALRVGRLGLADHESENHRAPANGANKTQSLGQSHAGRSELADYGVKPFGTNPQQLFCQSLVVAFVSSIRDIFSCVVFQEQCGTNCVSQHRIICSLPFEFVYKHTPRAPAVLSARR